MPGEVRMEEKCELIIYAHENNISETENVTLVSDFLLKIRNIYSIRKIH